MKPVYVVEHQRQDHDQHEDGKGTTHFSPSPNG
jgi:hypothetical protein